MSALKNYFLSNSEKLLISSINGGIFTYFPLEGNVKVFTTQNNSLKNLQSNSPFKKYYAQAFSIPKYDPVPSNRNDIPELKQMLFDEIPFRKDVFFKALQTSGSTIAEESLQINNKYFFQELVTETLGKQHATNPLLFKKNSPASGLMEQVTTLLKTQETLVVKIADESITRMGADHIRIFSNPNDFNSYLHESFSSAENGEISLMSNNDILAYDIIVESYISHVYSPSITFYLHEDTIEKLSINYQFIVDGMYIGSTNVLPSELNGTISELTEKAYKLAKKAHSMGCRGFIGFDTVIANQTVVFIEANYRTTGSTVPHITTQKAVRFTEEMEWLYVGSFMYNPKMSSVKDMLEYLTNKHMLYNGYEEYKKDSNKLFCTVTFGEREKRCGLCFFWKKNSIEVTDVIKRVNSILSEIGYQHTFINKDFL